MKKNKKNGQPPQLTTRKSEEITQEYQQLCIQLGNALVQFEVIKSQALTKYQQLNEEMLRAQAHEQAQAEQLKANLDAKADKLVNLVADKVSNEALNR